jgi:hypothetical protein
MAGESVEPGVDGGGDREGISGWADPTGTASTLLLTVVLSMVLELGVASDVDVEGASGGASALELLEVAALSWPVFVGGGGMSCKGTPMPDPVLLLQALAAAAARPAHGGAVELGPAAQKSSSPSAPSRPLVRPLVAAATAGAERLPPHGRRWWIRSPGAHSRGIRPLCG